MHNRPDDLIAAIFASILLIFVIEVAPDSSIRPVIGLFFLLLLPGYVLVSVFFPNEGKIDAIERIALSLGLSIAAFSLLGLMLYYAFSGIYLDALEFTLAGFVTAVAFIAWHRRTRLPDDERFAIDLEIDLSVKRLDWADRLLVVGIVVALSAALIMLSAVLSAPTQIERFSEIGLFGPTGEISGYPMDLAVNESAALSVSVGSHEASTMSYSLIILLQPENTTGANITHWRNGDPFAGTQSLDGGLAMAYNFSLRPSEYMNKTFSFSAAQNGTFKLRFMLFYEGQDISGQPYREGWVWMNIKS